VGRRRQLLRFQEKDASWTAIARGLESTIKETKIRLEADEENAMSMWQNARSCSAVQQRHRFRPQSVCVPLIASGSLLEFFSLCFAKGKIVKCRELDLINMFTAVGPWRIETPRMVKQRLKFIWN